MDLKEVSAMRNGLPCFTDVASLLAGCGSGSNETVDGTNIS
jgi:hypothetical protein